MIWLCQVGLRMVIFVVFWPECDGTLKVRFAALVTTPFFHSLHSKWNGSPAIDIINSTETKFLCRPSTGFDGSCTCKCDEIAPRDLGSKLVLHLAVRSLTNDVVLLPHSHQLLCHSPHARCQSNAIPTFQRRQHFGLLMLFKMLATSPS